LEINFADLICEFVTCSISQLIWRSSPGTQRLFGVHLYRQGFMTGHFHSFILACTPLLLARRFIYPLNVNLSEYGGPV
jgi:hypothetical protein